MVRAEDDALLVRVLEASPKVVEEKLVLGHIVELKDGLEGAG